MAQSKYKTTSGLHGVHQYVRLLCTLYLQRKSGVLSIESGRNVQQILFLDGNAVCVQSAIPFFQHLINAQTIDEEEWLSIQGQISENETAEDMLISGGVLSRAEIHEMQHALLEHGLEEPLNWERGNWKFQEKEELTGHRIDPELSSVPPTLSLIWNVIGPHLDKVSRTVSTVLSGHLQLDPQAKSVLGLIQERDSYLRLERIIQEGIGLELLLKKYPKMNAMVCFLFLLGFLRSAKREAEPEATQKTISNQAEKGVVQKNISIIRSDYRRRMQKDYYSFLKVSPDIPQAQLERSIRRLQRRWSGYQESVRTEPEISKKLAELLRAVQEIEGCFTDLEKKKEYDRMYRFGRAPLVNGSGVQQALHDPLQELRQLVQKGRYEDALIKLKERQNTVGLSADILAEIGWCQWNLDARVEAQDSIRLALGLDAHHQMALEYDARVSLSIGEPMRARKRLVSLLSQNPEHEWAKQSLQELDQKGDTDG